MSSEDGHFSCKSSSFLQNVPDVQDILGDRARERLNLFLISWIGRCSGTIWGAKASGHYCGRGESSTNWPSPYNVSRSSIPQDHHQWEGETKGGSSSCSRRWRYARKFHARWNWAATLSMWGARVWDSRSPGSTYTFCQKQGPSIHVKNNADEKWKESQA